MTPTRIAIMVVLLGIVASLAAWQWQRRALVSACREAGKVWDGGRCMPLPGPPILQRDLQRG